MQKVILILLLIGIPVMAQTPTPSPTPVKGFIDPCKLATMNASHAAWKVANCP